MSAPQYISNRQAVEFFESRLAGLAPDTVLKYHRTITELDTFLATHGLRIADIDEKMTADFAVTLMAQGLAVSTVARHLNILASLLGAAAKKGLLPATGAPADISRRIRINPVVPPLLTEKSYVRALTRLRADSEHPRGEEGVAEDILTWSLLYGAMPLAEVARLRKTEVRLPQPSDSDNMFAPILFSGNRRDPRLEEIFRRNATAMRSFLFPFGQNERTPRQLTAALASALRPLALRLGISVDGNGSDAEPLDPDALAASIWVSLAIRAGITPSDAIGCVGRPARYAVPSWCSAAEVAPEIAKEWIGTVARMLRREESRWYAMQLRRGVQFEDVRKEIMEKIRPVPELFYPCETITRVVRNKKVVQDQPYIRSTAFFRSTPEAILPMFRLIGDKAWCYRVNNTAGAPYAVIPTAQMRRFQAAVGVFTPDMEIHPLGTLTPRAGEQVIVIKAGYGEREGRVEEVLPAPDGSLIIRVLLATDLGYEWRVDLTPAQVERI